MTISINLNKLYFWYFLGAFVTLFFKWYAYVRIGKKMGKTLSEASKEWFFDPTLDNAVSWVATCGLVWACGVVWVEALPFPYLDSILLLPKHISIAFLLGGVIELAAPFFVKNLVNWISSRVQK